MNTDRKIPVAPKPEITRHPLLKKLADGNSHDLLARIAGLQLHRPNHGKNIRLEQLVMSCLPLFKYTDARHSITHGRIKYVVEQYEDNWQQEDPPVSMFTENVMFEGDNYTVLPGITMGQTDLLNQFLEIVRTDDTLLTGFRTSVKELAGALLTLSRMITEEVDLFRYMRIPDEDKKRHVVVPEPDVLDNYAAALTIPKAVFASRCQSLNIDPNVIKTFLLDPADPAVVDGSWEEPIITEKMIVESPNSYICVAPTSIVGALVEKIYKEARQHGVMTALMNAYYIETGEKVTDAFLQMGFRPEKITGLQPAEDLPILQAVFRFDRQKFAHVCIVIPYLGNSNTREQIALEKAIKGHAEAVAKSIKAAYGPGDAEVFTIYILSQMASHFVFGASKPSSADRMLPLNLSELKAVAYHKETDELTLWKFAGAYNKASAVTKIIGSGGVLDTFSIYYKNQGSMLPSDEAAGRGGAIVVAVGSSNDFQQEVKQYRDEHCIPKFVQSQTKAASVNRYREYGPIYIDQNSEHHFALVLERYQTPIWSFSDQHSKTGLGIWAYHVCEAILFWLMKMEPALREYLDGIALPVIDIEVHVDPAVADLDTIDATKVDQTDTHIVCSPAAFGVVLHLPPGFLALTGVSDNRADKALMESVLHAMNQLPRRQEAVDVLTEQQITDVVENILVPAQAKMILYNDASHNVQIDPRNLVSSRYLQDADISAVLESLVGWLGDKYVIPKKIATVAEKIQLTTDIVNALNSQIATEIAQYDGQKLLKYLIARHEKLVQEREFQELYLPARIACFSDFQQELEKMKKKGKQLVPTTFAYRTLIEYVASNPPFGTKRPNMDKVDYLLALMDMINDWGTVGDTLRLGLNDPEMGLLPSGRIGADKTMEREFFDKYRHLKTEAELFKFQENFNRIYQPRPRGTMSAPTDEVKKLDAAFEAEYEITFTEYAQLIGALMNIGFVEGMPCVVIDENELVARLVKDLPELSESKIKDALALLTLQQRPALGTPVAPYTFNDIATWRYNRALSHLRRPLVRIKNGSALTYMYGYRHLLDVVGNYYMLIGVGKLAASSAAMKTYLGAMAEERGKEFRNMVRDWFKSNTQFEVINHEVKIDRGKHLDAEKNYGDVDLLVIDHKRKIVYALECKAIYGARSIYEMKTEADQYLGRPGKEAKAKIGMHVERDKWLRANYNKVAAYLKLDGSYSVHSMLITAEPIPLPILKAAQVPLPITDFVQLRMNGVDALK